MKFGPKIETIWRIAAPVLTTITSVAIAGSDNRAEAVPALAAISDDLSNKTKIESASGIGPIAETLMGLFGRADGLSQKLVSGEVVRAETKSLIRATQDKMIAVLSDETALIWKRRSSLRALHAEMNRLLTQLDGAVPTSLVSSFAGELRSGALVPDRPEATAQINRALTGYAETLERVHPDQPSLGTVAPEFPSKTGAFDTLAPNYLAKFAPIYLLTFVVDVVFGMAIFTYALMTARTITPMPPKPNRVPTDAERILEARPMDITELTGTHSMENRNV